ncbi:hypothetical protein [Actinoplanes sp. NPDC089786]|uniref:hypothetical protein n=1 Tax=Actinoplanes sp. NPDC089786 TaxID=3155185 RepID=UPI003436EDB5
MTAPLVSSIFAVLFALAGYAAGRYHQWQRSATDREDAYRDGFDAATESTFSTAARIASQPAQPTAATPTATLSDPPIAAQAALATSSAGALGTALAPTAPPTTLPAQERDHAAFSAQERDHAAHAAQEREHAAREAQEGEHAALAAQELEHVTRAVREREQAARAAQEREHAARAAQEREQAAVDGVGQLAESAATFSDGRGRDAASAGVRSAPAGWDGRGGVGEDDETADVLSPIAESAVGMPLGYRHMSHREQLEEEFSAPAPHSFGGESADAAAGRRHGAEDAHQLERDGAAARRRAVEDSGAFFAPVVRDAGRAAEIQDEAPAEMRDPGRAAETGDRGGSAEGRARGGAAGRREAGGAAEGRDPGVAAGRMVGEPGGEGQEAEVPRRGRHYVPDELVQASTYRLSADRVARAKVPGSIKEGDEVPRTVPKPRSS